MANEVPHTTWPELAIDLYDKLTGRGAEITYEFENLEIYVPSSATAETHQAKWKLNGILKIRTRDLKQS
jgi:hypothetical protein